MIIIESSANIDKRAMFKLTQNGNLEKVKDHDGEQFTISEYVIFEDVNSEGKTQEVLAFITTDGEAFGSNSPTVIKSFRKMLEVFDLPIEDVKIVSGESKHGTRYFNIVLA